MRARLCLLAAVGLVATGLAASTYPELPTWDEAEDKQLEESGWLPGTELLPDESAPSEPNPLDAETPTVEDLAEPDIPVPGIPEEDLATYFGARPTTVLIDPQRLLDADAGAGELEILENHAAESTIDLFIYVFGKDQEIPGEVREEELIERFFITGRPAVIVYYFLGQPRETVLYVSPSITDVINAVEQRRALASAVMHAEEKADPPQQLQAFTRQMAIRIYGMERMLGGGQAATDERPPASHSKTAKQAKPPHSTTALAPLIEQWQSVWNRYSWQVVAAAAVLVVACGLGLWWRFWATYRLPEFEVEPRLGGDHAAGVGAVISFASPALPPATQRRQTRHYLQRL